MISHYDIILTTRQYIDFSHNKLTGNLDILTMLSSAKYINLSSNIFTGNFPEFSPQKLVTLDLSSNLLNGIPSLSRLKQLRYVNLSNNLLIGRLFIVQILKYIFGAKNVYSYNV